MQTHSLQVRRSARFHASGELRDAREIWFLLHGYGQLASSMLDACAVLATAERVLIAPEALSRFYTRGGSGAIGASWMTREERDSEITDYVAYLDAVAQRIVALGARAALPRNVLGFSQGAATASRWACRGATRFEHMCLWGGGVPTELPNEVLQSRLATTRVTLVRGASDAVHDEPAVERDVERLRAAGVTVNHESFGGGHNLDADMLERIALSS